jgi:hypothetical protein
MLRTLSRAPGIRALADCARIILGAITPAFALAQVDEDQVGGWYAWQGTVNRANSTLGFQGDIQHRNWDLARDMEQLLARGGLTWQPTGSAVKYTLGYAHIVSGAFGASSATSKEHRLYQEALLPQRWGARGFVTHRVRFEQRDVQNLDFRTRLRYFIGYNRPLNADTLGRGALYLALANEVFFNGERGIGRGRSVSWFDRNRASAGFGYALGDTSRVQLSYMHQNLEHSEKGQIQLNWIQSF